MGAPKGNANAIHHGLLTAGALPAGAGYVGVITAKLRDAIERAVIDQKGELSLHDAATAQSALRWERHSLLCQRWLRREFDSMSLDQRLAFSRDAARASAERDKCLRALGLDNDRREGLFDSLYAQVHAVEVDEADTDADEDRDDGRTEDAAQGADQGADQGGQPDDNDGRTLAAQANGGDAQPDAGETGIGPDARDCGAVTLASDTALTVDAISAPDAAQTPASDTTPDVPPTPEEIQR